jgi:hypothetical protein
MFFRSRHHSSQGNAPKWATAPYALRPRAQRQGERTRSASTAKAAGWNFVLLAAVIGVVLMSGLWKPGIDLEIAGAHLPCRSSSATSR